MDKKRMSVKRGDDLSNRISKNPEERRKELIEVASKLFEKYGYEKVSVRDILYIFSNYFYACII